MKKQTYNPFLPSWEYVPDGEPRVFGERLYLFGSHDRFDGNDFCLNDYVCWSAPTYYLGDWQMEGIIYKATQDPLNADGAQNLFAPDVVQGADGRYYLFYCLNRSTVVAVAVCDTPAGQYEFYGHVRHPDGGVYGQKPGDPFNFDPGVLIDNDGKIYLYTGFSPNPGPLRDMLGKSGMQVDGSYCVELEQDMLTMKSAPRLVAPCAAKAEGTGFEGHAFYEASSPRRIGDTYYLVYSSQLSHDLCYAVCDKPDGNYRYGGVIVSIGDVGLVETGEAVNYTGNTHGGIVEIGGEWYVFYHRQTNGHRNSRQACAERIRILPDGSIPQVEVTSCGLNGGPLPAAGKYEARIACNLSSADGTFEYGQDKAENGGHPYFTQSGADREENGDQYIANMQNGAWCGFKHFAFSGKEHSVSVQYRGNADGKLVMTSERGGKAVAEFSIASAETWQTASAELQPLQGVTSLFFTFQGVGSMDFLLFQIS